MYIQRCGDAVTVGAPFLCGWLLLAMAQASNTYVVYALLVLYHCVFEVFVAVSAVKIAAGVAHYSRLSPLASVFSANAAFGMAIQTLLQIGVRANELDVFHQFQVFGVFLVATAVVLFAIRAGLVLATRSGPAASVEHQAVADDSENDSTIEGTELQPPALEVQRRREDHNPLIATDGL
mmetsp:Transcript_42466/g.92337  ORF Transcript_42466/g.92337 Transcript_42466/m.92337 type:complete len:179 (-) Transcript_42466:72-608(-)